MDGTTTLLFLSFTMLVGSLISGLLPLTLTLSEVKMRHITVIGAGLLIGTALAVIIPEGIHSLNSISDPHQDHLQMSNHNHAHKRSISSFTEILPIANLSNSGGDSLSILPEKLQNTTTLTRAKRHEDTKTNESIDRHNEQNPIKEIIKSEKEKIHTDHKHSTSHSGIGVSLVLGFIFMLIIDHLGGKYGHGHAHQHQLIDNQTMRNKITFSTTLGLVVHAAADGIALGAAASTQKTDVEMIVFFAIMLHKAPAAFGLVSFLIHEGLERARIRRHLLTFAIAAPAMAILTFLFLKSNMFTLPDESTGYCMLFSAGTFLYVSTVHVLPEIQSHNENRQFSLTELVSFILGSILPVFLAIGHHH